MFEATCPKCKGYNPKCDRCEGKGTIEVSVRELEQAMRDSRLERERPTG